MLRMYLLVWTRNFLGVRYECIAKIRTNTNVWSGGTQIGRDTRDLDFGRLIIYGPPTHHDISISRCLSSLTPLA